MATFNLSTSPQSQSILLLLLLLFLLVITDFDSGSVLVEGVDDYNRADFPTDFVFGAGTSAYQVEGAALEDGRTRSIFDTFALGYSDNDGDIACDGYHKYKEDVQLMVDTGLEAFRFSISWSRLIPNGTGPINPKGLQFYNNFINELISKGGVDTYISQSLPTYFQCVIRDNIICPPWIEEPYPFICSARESRNDIIKVGIQPHVTICHSDLPQVLEDKYGGWLSRRSVKDFTAYADVCFKEFGDRVSYWTTINEANIFVFGGYDQGLTQPARCSFPFGVRNCSAGNSTYEPYIAAHNILLAHASAARLYEKKYKEKQHGYIGLNLFAFGFVPHTNTMEDVIATQRAQDFFHGWFANPLVFGDYPESMKKNAGTRIPAFTEEESKRVKGSFDFLAVNHYMTLQIKDKSSNLQSDNRDFESDMAAEMKFDVGDTPPDQYPNNPPGLQGVLEYFKHAYGNPPIYVHENGQRMKRDSQLNDTPRVEYLHGYIGSVLDAIRNGSNTRGYFHWSFMDVYELLFSYNSAFGLYYVDREDKDLTRHPKLSAHWYSNFLKGRNVQSDQNYHLLEGKHSQFHFSQ